MDLSQRQKNILEIVQKEEPISSKDIAKKLGLSRTALRADLSVLTMLNILEAKPRVGYFYKGEESKLRDIEKLFNLSVNEIMSRPVNVKEEVSIYDAVVSMFLEDTGTVFVIDDKEQLSGVVSRKDLLKMSIGHSNLKNTPVSLAMTRMPKIITIKPDNTFFEAARKISDNEIDALPVITEENKVIGRVSKTNITDTLVDFQWE